MSITKLVGLDTYLSGEDVFPDQEPFSRYKKAIPQERDRDLDVFAAGIYSTALKVAPGLLVSILLVFEREGLAGTCEEARFLLDVIDDIAGVSGNEKLLRYWLDKGLSIPQIWRSLAVVVGETRESYSAAKYYRLLAFEMELELENWEEQEPEQSKVCYSNWKEG